MAEIYCPHCKEYLDAKMFSESRRGNTGNVCIKCMSKVTEKRAKNKKQESKYLKKNNLFDYNDTKLYAI